jgi:methyl-accepting chemotaxis protein
MGESIYKVAGLMDEVTATAQEQAANVEHVNKAILQIDQVTQENATMVEQNASSSEGMAAQARALLQLVSFFKTGEGSGSLGTSEEHSIDLPALDSFEGRGRVPRLASKPKEPYQPEGEDSREGFSEF